MKHAQFEILDALRIIRIHQDPLLHHISHKHANAVLTFSANWLPVLEELLSQLVHLKKGAQNERRRVISRNRNDVNETSSAKFLSQSFRISMIGKHCRQQKQTKKVKQQKQTKNASIRKKKTESCFTGNILHKFASVCVFCNHQKQAVTLPFFSFCS